MGKKSVVVENFTCFTDDVERNVRTVGRLSLIERRGMLTANAKPCTPDTHVYTVTSTYTF